MHGQKEHGEGSDDAVKSVAGAALGAAAIAATGVVVSRVAGAIRKRGKDLEEATPQLQRLAGGNGFEAAAASAAQTGRGKEKGYLSHKENRGEESCNEAAGRTLDLLLSSLVLV